MTWSREFIVPGDPIPQGSMKAFAVKGKAFTTSSNAGPLARYRNDIRNAYGERYGMEDSLANSISVHIVFTFKRPASHYNAKGQLKGVTYAKPAPDWVTKKPDIDKLIRAVLDALSFYAYEDDAQVVHVDAIKRWGERSETAITVKEM